MQEDSKEPKISKNYMNSLAIRRGLDSLQLIYPDQTKQRVNVDAVKIDQEGMLSSFEKVATGVSLLKRANKQTQI